MANITYRTTTGRFFDIDNVEVLSESELETEIAAAIEAFNDLYSEDSEVSTIVEYEGILDRFIDKGELDPDYFEFIEAVNSSSYDEEVFLSGLDCGLSLDQIEDAYQGEYRSDADFAQEMADQLGYIDRNVSWPYTCIDWEQAAEELMCDYVSENDHYFLNV